jgi:transcriptional regulator PpsR
LADLAALAGLAPELASTFASIASDIALVIDPDGVIRSVALGDAPLSRQARHWVGRPFIDTVTQDTRSKITQLLQEVDSTGVSRRREVNLPGTEGREIPVAFAAIRLGTNGPVLAVGRDLRAIAAIQQRFVEAQQELERDYWRQRQAESRYRLLFQVATDAVMVVDAATLIVVEANRAAADLFGCAPDQLTGQPATEHIDTASRPAVDELLITARSSGRPAEIRARLGAQAPAPAVPVVDISATPFRAKLEGTSQRW